MTVYCLVVEHYRAYAALYPIGHGGVAPEVSAAEGSTLEICGEYLNHQTDQALVAYCHAHHRHFCPTLTDRRVVVRHAATLWQVKAALPPRLPRRSGPAADPGQAIDTRPVPVCPYPRGGRGGIKASPWRPTPGTVARRSSPLPASSGGLRIPQRGRGTQCPLRASRPHDSTHLEALLEGCTGRVPADQGCLAAVRQERLPTHHASTLLTPARARMAPPPHAKAVRKAAARGRQRRETVGAQLTERVASARIRVRDRWHFQPRVLRKGLAHPGCVFLNPHLGRSPLDLDGLVCD